MALLSNGDIQHFAMGVPAIQHASGDPLNSSPYYVEKIFDYRSGKYPIDDVHLHYIPDDYIIIVLYRSLYFKNNTRNVFATSLMSQFNCEQKK